MKTALSFLASLSLLLGCSTAFQCSPPSTSLRRALLLGAASTASERSVAVESTEAAVDQLKGCLKREYASFFSPMEREFYAESVTFDDPMTALEGVDSYERNVNMLSGKNLIGNLLFRDAGIVLHNIEGGRVIVEKDDDDGTTTKIEDLMTRWTLRLTFQALPWQPTARFSGISVYEVQPGGSKGVQVTKQTDYWDSINIGKGGAYQSVPKGKAFGDFLDQLKPENFAAPSAGAELPYQLLRRGSDYEVRRYPAYTAVQTAYEQRDEGFSELGAFCSGLSPLAPALFDIQPNQPKKMQWPLGFSPPGSDEAPELPAAAEKAQQKMWKDTCEIVRVPARVVAVGSFSDASVEPVVRKADRLLRESCERDGLELQENASLCFAQYDAIFSMGKRRGEVWIDLAESHPWTATL